MLAIPYIGDLGGWGRIEPIDIATEWLSTDANTKTSWQEITTSSSHDYDALVVQLSYISGTSDPIDVMVDIGVGAEYSEVVIAENLFMRSSWDAQQNTSYYIPIPIPAGTRISARFQKDLASTQTLRINTYGLTAGSEWTEMGKTGYIHCLGATTSSATELVNVDTDGSAWSWGSWTEISSSCPVDARGVQLAIDRNYTTGTPTDLAHWFIEIGVGSNPNEETILNLRATAKNSSWRMVMPSSVPVFPVQIASGERISARIQCSDTATSYRKLQIGVYVWG